MYVLKCARCGRYPRSNKNSKGQFTLKFKDLTSMIAFMERSRSKLFFPGFLDEDKQFVKIVNNKYIGYDALVYRRHINT